MSRKSELYIKQMPVGPMDNFIYFMGDENRKEVAVVDPAWDANYLREEAEEQGLKITAVILTHSHHDHINGLDDMLSTHNVPVYISKIEAEYYNIKHENLVMLIDGDKFKIGDIEIECILTPGHTAGSISLLFGEVLLTGDVLFIDGCGRCDLPGGNASVMYHTLYDVILKLPDSTVIYPGHNYGPTETATLGNQRKTNPYLTCKDEHEFVVQRMGLTF